MGLHKIKYLLLFKGNNWQREKLAYKIEKDMCKLVTRQESVPRICKKDIEYQKSRQISKQMKVQKRNPTCNKYMKKCTP